MIDHLEHLSESDCYLHLHRRTLGRIAIHLADDLVVLPVYYAMLDHDVVFRTSPGTKLDAAVMGARVAFEVDSASPGWSVLVRGHAHELRDDAETTRARYLLGNDWPAGERERYVRIVAEHVTGRALT